MKLMSSLLFGVLLAASALALRGHSGNRYFYSTRQLIESREKQKTMLMNTNGGALIHKTFPLESEEIGPSNCQQCSQCINLAVLAINKTTHVAPHTTRKPFEETLRQDMLAGPRRHVKSWRRPKRFIDPNNMPSRFNIKLDNARERLRNSRSRKAITVTKYKKNGRVVALKIKEIHRQAVNDPTDLYGGKTCRVYVVKDSFDCQAADGPYFLKSELTGEKMHPRLQYEALQDLVDKINKQTSNILRKRDVNSHSDVNSQSDVNFFNNYYERKSLVRKNIFNNRSIP
ncbi:hypothetical protein JYU34_015760 [Plutella xylostella]|uniref:Uncharacterized protein n=1 Tax=Plutella xylostella TaxID=51655 RepID=A0ABQ7Q4N2_PLUXY|nr:hypothetical protein JYU34_015760 [Plutella xylostella]